MLLFVLRHPKRKWSHGNLVEIFSFLFLLTGRFSLGKVNCFNVFNDWQGLEKMKTDPSQGTTVGIQETGTSCSKEVSGWMLEKT